MKILFVCSGNSSNKISPIVKAQGDSLLEHKIDLEYFPLIGKGIKGYIKNIFLLRRYLKESKFDLIHAHYGHCGIISHLARTNEKLLVSFMGNDLKGDVNKNNTIKFFSRILVGLNKYFAKYKFDTNIVKSEELKNILPVNTKATILPNGVNLGVFKNQLRDISCNKKIVLFASDPGRPEKNFPLAKAAFDKISKENSNIELLTVYGKTQNELNVFYNKADCLLLTSIHEGSPNVIKEAMACCLPIVTTDVGDVKYILGETPGTFISSYSADDVALKLKSALEFSKPTKGRERIIEMELDSTNVALKLIEIYSATIKK